MQAAPSVQICVDMTPDGRIRMRGYSVPFLTLVHSLPGAKFHRDKGFWTCDLTNAACYRLVNGGPNFTICQDVQDMARDFAMGLAAVRQTVQPPLRKGDLWSHQVTAYHHSMAREASLLGMDMGTGKSKVAVSVMDNITANRTLVLCPVSVRNVWRRELDRHAARGYEVMILEKGSSLDKGDKLMAFIKRCLITGNPFVVVVNYESAKRKDLARVLLEVEWDLIVADEVHRLKGHSSQVSKFAHELSAKGKRRLGLSGTPLPHSPLDAFGVYRFLDSGIFGTSWFNFCKVYAEKRNPYVPQMITGYTNLPDLSRKIGWLHFQCKASDVLDLPPITHQDIPVMLDKKTREHYQELETELITEVKGGVVTCANALVKVLRLSQVASGFLCADESKTIVEIGSEKEEALLDFLSDLAPTEPVVVFCRFVHDLTVVERVAKRLKRRYGELSGRTKSVLTDEALMREDIDIAGVQIQSGGVGIDLTRARYAVYYNVGYSLAEYDQSIARLHRPGQVNHTYIYHLICQNTVDEKVYQSFQDKREILDYVLNGFKNQI